MRARKPLLPAGVSSSSTSTRSRACRSTRRTACTARPATSRPDADIVWVAPKAAGPNYPNCSDAPGARRDRISRPGPAARAKSELLPLAPAGWTRTKAIVASTQLPLSHQGRVACSRSTCRARRDDEGDRDREAAASARPVKGKSPARLEQRAFPRPPRRVSSHSRLRAATATGRHVQVTTLRGRARNATRSGRRSRQ